MSQEKSKILDTEKLLLMETTSGKTCIFGRARVHTFVYVCVCTRD